MEACEKTAYKVTREVCPTLGRSESRLRGKNSGVDIRNGKEGKVKGYGKDEENGEREMKKGKGHSLYDEHGFLKSSPARR